VSAGVEFAGWPSWSASDLARRRRTLAQTASRAIPSLLQLPMVTEAEAWVRSPEQIARRLLAMFGVCVRAEVLNGGAPAGAAQKYLDAIDRMLDGGLRDELTPDETAFLADPEPSPVDLATFDWRYECCHVLLWALGAVDELGYPDDLCDVGAMAGVIWHTVDVGSLLAAARPRAAAEVLDAADLILAYDWACVDARVKGRPAPGGLNGEVVVEWHRAVNWLVGAYDSADWDDVGTDT